MMRTYLGQNPKTEWKTQNRVLKGTESFERWNAWDEYNIIIIIII